MRTALILCVTLGFPILLLAQSRLVNPDYKEYYHWFQQHSQTSLLFQDESRLYVFSESAKVHQRPCRESAVITELAGGDAATNISYGETWLPEDIINGYGDLWFHVCGKDANGKTFRGYLWGGDLARGWRQADITGDGHPEFIMLGIASLTRSEPSEMNAELRVFQNGHLLAQALVPGLCIFQECDTDVLLRVINDPELGTPIIETSTLFAGCQVGIEKAFFHWNGRKLMRIFHAEFTTNKEYARKDLSFPLKTATADGIAVKVCQFSHEDRSFNPVWKCQTLIQRQVIPEVPEKPIVSPRARAR